jgi:hypothetical protein
VNALGLDLSAAIEAKMQKNALKYPTSLYRGRFELPPNANPPTD